jgi:hypothetical protein
MELRPLPKTCLYWIALVLVCAATLIVGGLLIVVAH